MSHLWVTDGVGVVWVCVWGGGGGVGVYLCKKGVGLLL